MNTLTAQMVDGTTRAIVTVWTRIEVGGRVFTSYLPVHAANIDELLKTAADNGNVLAVSPVGYIYATMTPAIGDRITTPDRLRAAIAQFAA